MDTCRSRGGEGDILLEPVPDLAGHGVVRHEQVWVHLDPARQYPSAGRSICGRDACLQGVSIILIELPLERLVRKGGPLFRHRSVDRLARTESMRRIGDRQFPFELERLREDVGDDFLLLKELDDGLSLAGGRHSMCSLSCFA